MIDLGTIIHTFVGKVGVNMPPQDDIPYGLGTILLHTFAFVGRVGVNMPPHDMVLMIDLGTILHTFVGRVGVNMPPQDIMT